MVICSEKYETPAEPGSSHCRVKKTLLMIKLWNAGVNKNRRENRIKDEAATRENMEDQVRIRD
jgi:hypothetical protein